MTDRDRGSEGGGGDSGRDDSSDAGRAGGDESARGTDVDPVTLEVLRNACSAVAEEMNATLLRTAYSPNVTDRRDCSCALFDPAGAMLSQAENIPVHLGAMPFSVAAALAAHPPETLAPGDAIALNDPFHGGAHLPDVTLVTPVFAGDLACDDGESVVDDGESAVDDGESVVADERRHAEHGDLVALAANRAHHADVGGATAGSVGADATEIYAEGLRVPPVKLVRDGEFDDDLLATLLANVRTPDERRGDLRAQVAANEVGVERVRELVADHGRATFADAVAAIQDYSERRMRAAIAELPDGEYDFADVLDDDGHGTDDVRIEATVTVDDDALAVDFAGSAPQTASPLNAVRAVTVSATYFAVRCVTDPEIPPTAGTYRPVDVSTPVDSVVDASPPAAVVGGNLEVSQRVADVVFGALAAVAPERAVAAGQGTMNNVTIGGTDPRGGVGGASGGRSAVDAGAGSDACAPDRDGDRDRSASATGSGAPDRDGDRDRSAAATDSGAPDRDSDRDRSASAAESGAPDCDGDRDRAASATDSGAPDRDGDRDRSASATGSGAPYANGDRDRAASATGSGAPYANGEPSGSPFAFYETQAGGFGGRAGADGMDAVHVHMSNTRNTPAEVLETAYPLAVERYELRPDSGGAGEFRGGLGVRRDLRVRTDDATLSLLGDRRRTAPYGIEGGEDGATGEDVLVRDGEAIDLPSKCTRELERGDVVSVRTPGGGGYGDPADRSPDTVRRDVRLGTLSRAAARELYGVDVEE